MAETFNFLTLYSTDTSCDINNFECIFSAHWMCNFIAIPTFCTANRWHWRDLCSSQPGSFQSLFPLLSSSLLQLSCLFKENWLISLDWSLWSTISIVHILILLLWHTPNIQNTMIIIHCDPLTAATSVTTRSSGKVDISTPKIFQRQTYLCL